MRARRAPSGSTRVVPRGGHGRWTRLIPVILVVYTVAYMDRVNIGFALPHMKDDLQLTGAQQGLAAGIFFIGYLFLQVPGGYLAERWSVRKWVSLLIVGWGICAVASGLVRSYEQLLVVRFLLGLAEGGVPPALMVLIKRWFPLSERGRAFSLFVMHNPIAVIVLAPFSGLILSFAGWRELFVIQGALPSVIALIAWLAVVDDEPSRCRWLSAEERNYILTQQALQEGDEKVPNHPAMAVRSRQVWVLSLTYLLALFGFYGLQLWLPTMLEQVFTGDLTVGLVAALPPLTAGVAIWYNGRAADRDRRYVLRTAVPLVVGGTTLIASTQLGPDHSWLIVATLCVATACQLSFFGPFWALASRLVPVAAAGVSFALINAIGNVGGLLGPYVGGRLQDATGGSLVASGVFFALAVIVAAALMLTRHVEPDHRAFDHRQFPGLGDPR